MNQTSIKWINYLAAEPKILFLIDGIGAGITALVLLLLNLNNAFGMPNAILTFLSLIAVCFCLYSISCFILLKEKSVLFIRIICIANVLYCSLTLSLVCIHYQQLTALGTAYFLGEIAIIFGLAYIEIAVAGRILQIKMTASGDSFS